MTELPEWKSKLLKVRFQVFTAASMKMTVFWDVAPCSVLEIDRRFKDSKHLWNVGQLLPPVTLLKLVAECQDLRYWTLKRSQKATLLESRWIKKRPDAIVSTGRWSSEHDPVVACPLVSEWQIHVVGWEHTSLVLRFVVARNFIPTPHQP
jgi:hypothetical protein